MKFQKVIYNLGDDNIYDYFILVEKNEVKLDKNSLAYKFDTSNDISFILNHKSLNGNFDFVLEKKTKNGEFKGLEFCNSEDIELI